MRRRGNSTTPASCDTSFFFEEAHERQVYPHGSVGDALVVVVPVDEERVREEHQALSSALYPPDRDSWLGAGRAELSYPSRGALRSRCDIRDPGHPPCSITQAP